MHKRLALILLVTLVPLAASAQSTPFVRAERSCDAVAALISSTILRMQSGQSGAGAGESLSGLVDAYDVMQCDPSELRDRVEEALTATRRGQQ